MAPLTNPLAGLNIPSSYPTAPTASSAKGPIIGYDGMGMPIYGPSIAAPAPTGYETTGMGMPIYGPAPSLQTSGPVLESSGPIAGFNASYPIDPTTGKPIIPPLPGQTPFDPNMMMTLGPVPPPAPSLMDSLQTASAPTSPIAQGGFSFLPSAPSLMGSPAQTAPSTPVAPTVAPLSFGDPEVAALTTWAGLTNPLMATAGGAYNPAMELAWNASKAAGGPNSFQTGALGYLDQGTALSPAEQAALSTVQQLIAQSGTNNPFAQEAATYARQGATANPAEQAALNQLGFFSQGALGSSPATLAAMSAFNQFSVPEIEQQLALAGLGRSGAVGQSIGDAQAKAMVPLLQTEMANRLQAANATAGIGQAEQARQIQTAGIMAGLSQQEINALLGAAGVQAGVGGAQQGRTIQAGNIMGNIGQNVGQQALQDAQIRANLGTSAAQQQLQAAQLAASVAAQQAQIGNTLAQRARADAAAALQAAGIPREVALQQAEAAYQEFLRQQRLAEAVTTGPLGQVLPSTIGSTTKQGGGGGLLSILGT